MKNFLTKEDPAKNLERILKEYPPRDYMLIHFLFFIYNVRDNYVQVLTLRIDKLFLNKQLMMNKVR